MGIVTFPLPVFRTVYHPEVVYPQQYGVLCPPTLSSRTTFHPRHDRSRCLRVPFRVSGNLFRRTSGKFWVPLTRYTFTLGQGLLPVISVERSTKRLISCLWTLKGTKSGNGTLLSRPSLFAGTVLFLHTFSLDRFVLFPERGRCY